MINNNNHRPEEVRRVIWVANIRSTILLSLAIIVVLIVLTKIKFDVYPILGTLVFIFIYNALTIFLVRTNPNFCRSNICTYFQFLFDLFAVTSLVHFSGGLESPFAILYLLFSTIAALFYGSSFAIFIAGISIILFTGLNRLESLNMIKHYTISIPPSILYGDLRFLFIYAASFFFISLALIYAVSYLADKFREKQREIEEMSSEKIDFMNNVAHELRSPLTSIKEYTSLFLEGFMGSMAQNQREPLEIIDRQAKRMINMISDLLDIARIESGNSGFEKNEVNITQIIENSITEMMPQFNLKHIILLKEIENNLPIIKIDETKILEVMINLFSNAIKFSNEGGKIIISAKKSDEGMTVSIKDEGYGIESHDLPHIFEKFYRAKKENSHLKGTGLGLALCKSIIDRHNGKILVESGGLGKGSTFHFTLPFK
jgi:signal transduction histidine kinase